MTYEEIRRLRELMEAHGRLPFPTMPATNDPGLDQWEDTVEIDAEIAGMVTTVLAGGKFDREGLGKVLERLRHYDESAGSLCLSQYRSTLRELAEGLYRT